LKIIFQKVGYGDKEKEEKKRLEMIRRCDEPECDECDGRDFYKYVMQMVQWRAKLKIDKKTWNRLKEISEDELWGEY